MALNLEQEDLAFLMDLDSTQISKWEQGERLPGIYNAIGLAAATGRLVEDIFFDFRREWQERFKERRKLIEAVRESKTYSHK
jgi:transcriptional regulator with XRE-family HTH domain